jgi:hypothetical protein
MWDKVLLGGKKGAQGESIQSNIDVWNQIMKLSDLYNTYVQKQYPWFQGLLNKGVSTAGQMFDVAGQWLKGIPDAATEAATRRAAAQGNLQSGWMGSGGGDSWTARSLGLLPKQFIEAGANLATTGGNAAQRWANIGSNMFLDPKSFFISPQDQWAANYANEAQTQRSEQLVANREAAPDPGLRFLSDLVAYETGQYLGSLGGGGMGGMGGGGGKGGLAGMGTNFQNFGLNQSGNAFNFTPPAGTTQGNDWFNWG